MILLYRTLIEPYLRYCNATWGNCGETLLNRLQTLQNRAATVPPSDIGNCVMVDKPRAYLDRDHDHDHDHEKSALGSNAALPN